MTVPSTPPTAAKASPVIANNTKAASIPASVVVPTSSGSDGPTPTSGTVYNMLRKNWNEEAQLNAILSGDHFVGNLANQFTSLTYDWKLYCMPPRDYLAEFDGDAAADIKVFLAKLDAYPQTIIADTGVTGYNITEVEVENLMAEKNTATTQITMKIVEPNGVSFFDALAEAADSAGIENYHDFYYFLELSFKGYGQNGEIETNPFTELENGGRWVWGVKITNIAANLGVGGGEYMLTMLPVEQQATELNGEYGSLLDTIIVRGDTLGEFFDELAEKINASWTDRLFDSDIVNHKFEFHSLPIPADVPTVVEAKSAYDTAQANAKKERRQLIKDQRTGKTTYNEQEGMAKIEATAATPKKAQEAVEAAQTISRVKSLSQVDAIRALPMRPEHADYNTLRTAAISIITPDADADGISKQVITEAGDTDTAAFRPTGHFAQGSQIEQIVSAICGACEALQTLAKDSSANPQTPDDAEDKVNDQGHRQVITWDVQPEMRLDGRYDSLSNRYYRAITWHIYPRISQNVILSSRQIIQANEADVQKRMLAALAGPGFLPKKYDYLYTGLNTEVIDFDLNFEVKWAAVLPNMIDYYDEQVVQHNRYNGDADPLTGNPLEQNAIAIRNKQKFHETFVQIQNDTIEKFKRGDLQKAEAEAIINKARQESIEQQKIAYKASMVAKTFRAQNPTSIPKEPEQDYSREYVEDILDENVNQPKDIATNQISRIPLSFSAQNEQRNATGPGIVGQYHSGKSIYGSILNQVYGPQTTSFIDIKMKIKGDPFWIGRGSFEYAIAHKRETIDNKYSLNSLNGNACMLLEFKYPSGVGDDSRIELKNNNIVSGIYGVTSVTNSFSNGTFTQMLSAVRYTLFDLSMSLANVDSTILNKDIPQASKPDQTLPPVRSGGQAQPSLPTISSPKEVQSPNTKSTGIDSWGSKGTI